MSPKELDEILDILMPKKNFFKDHVYKKYDPEVTGFGGPRKWRALFEACISPEEARTGEASGERKRTLYAILGLVEGENDRKRIKSAYRERSLKTHPDRAPINNMTKEGAEEAFKAVSEAYSILGDEDKKRA